MKTYNLGDQFKVPASLLPEGKTATATIVSMRRGLYYMKVIIDGSTSVTQMLNRTAEQMDEEGFVQIAEGAAQVAI